jgi:hypothetical protein
VETVETVIRAANALESVLQGARGARDEFARMKGTLLVRVSILDGGPIYKGYTDDPLYADDLLQLDDTVSHAANIRRMTDQDVDVRLPDSKVRIVAERWQNMIVALAIDFGNPSNKSLKRKFRRVASKFDPAPQAPAAPASAMDPWQPASDGPGPPNPPFI